MLDHLLLLAAKGGIAINALQDIERRWRTGMLGEQRVVCGKSRLLSFRLRHLFPIFQRHL